MKCEECGAELDLNYQKVVLVEDLEDIVIAFSCKECLTSYQIAYESITIYNETKGEEIW